MADFIKKTFHTKKKITLTKRKTIGGGAGRGGRKRKSTRKGKKSTRKGRKSRKTRRL
jgi:hypothetical protein